MSQDQAKLTHLYPTVKDKCKKEHARWNTGDDFQPEVNIVFHVSELKRHFVVIAGEIVNDFAHKRHATRYLNNRVPKEKQKCGYTVAMEKLGVEP
jgi:hypothetical protein